MDTSPYFSKVKKILDGITYYVDLKDYVMFDDNWISDHDKILYNPDGESLKVLDFREVTDNTLVMPDLMPYMNGWRLLKVSCVKLDKKVNVGDLLTCIVLKKLP